ncbi:hypothetical protein F4824DRAFT_498586 [Ustulina deusta]|nr:hypothetical protein F4824DRAFT_498586 [Ustulina deusta]
MHSRPFTSPTQRGNGLPTRLCARNYGRTSIPHDEAVPLVNLDAETNHLLPRRQRPLRVRIQGRLAIVRTVSVANLRPARTGAPTARADTTREYVRGSPMRRRGSDDGSEVEEEEEEDDDDDDDDDDVVEGDAQFRGYGIGGAGNIRRPTEVMGAPSSASTSLSSLDHTSPHSPAISPDATKSGKLRLRMAGLLQSLRGYNRSQGSAGDL